MLPAMVKNWMVAEEWESMDHAIYSLDRLRLLNGAYWFWLMSDYDEHNPRMLQVLISRGAIDYTLNQKRFTNAQIDDETFKCFCGIWQFKDGELTDLILDNCTGSVTEGQFSCITESGYEISISNSFPHYDLSVRYDQTDITRFRAVSSRFNGKYVQNPLVPYPSYISFSEDFDTYTRNSRGFQYFMASKMSDQFGSCQGTLFDRDFEGSFWLERCLGFGSTLPWKIIMVNFNDRSRLWYRYFPSRFLNYGNKLEFIFDDMDSKQRYHFSDMTFHYTGPAQGPTRKFGPGVDTVHLTGKGKQGEQVNITAKILGRHLYQYRVGIHFNYNQLVLDIQDISIQVKGIDLVKGKKATLSYGEDAYFSI